MKQRTVVHTFLNQFLPSYYYLFSSSPNVYAVSAQTTGTVMQAYFPDGSHLPVSPLLSLAHLGDDSQHISLAAICLSAFTANQTSEQPNSLMGGRLETSPHMPVLLYLPLLFFFPPLHLQSKLCLCFVLSSELSFLIPSFFLSLFGPPASVSSFFLHPPPSPAFPFSFLLAECSHIFACSCEGVSDVRVARGGRGSSRA